VLRVVAPSQERLEGVVAELMGVAARSLELEGVARLEEVTQQGVAPDSFYSTTIYPTEVHLEGGWCEVEKQRMDTVIVVRPGASPTRHIRDRRGKIVVVAGPVVVHTGGSKHLSSLIEAGFVQALLTGNALPVHDIEHDLFGTSLGVDLSHRRPVREGHRNHLMAINRVRAAGGIRQAVETGNMTPASVRLICVDISPAVVTKLADRGSLESTGIVTDVGLFLNLLAASFMNDAV
jgi:hypothetical protein